MPDTWDRVRITLERRGTIAKVEVNGVEIKAVTKLQVLLDGADRMSRVMIELMPDVIEVEGDVSVLTLIKPDRLLIPRQLAEATSSG